jgi:hypothetical protein
MKIILSVVILSLFVTAFGEPVRSSTRDEIAVFGLNKHTDEDEKPSRDDSRYQNYTLYIYADKTFKLIHQTGRLGPKYEIKTGTWDVTADELKLSMQERQFTDSAQKKVIEKQNSSMIFIKSSNKSITYGKDRWKLQRGLGFEELQSKYLKTGVQRKNYNTFDPEKFSDKMRFAITLLNKQPKQRDLVKLLPANITIDSLQEFKYFFRYMGIDPITADLHLQSHRIVLVEFSEEENNLKALTSFIHTKYTYMGSEHNCDYYNDKKTSIVIIPGMNKKTLIHVSRYEK